MHATDEKPWADLVVAARGGGAEGVDDLLRAVQPLVLGRCRRLLPSPADAEEAAQDALVNVAAKLETFDPARGTFRAWASVVASNSARSTYRSLKRRSSELSTETAGERVDPRRTSVIAGTRLDVMDALEALEVAHPALIEAFVLRDLAGLPYQEAASLTGTPVGTVKARVHRARDFMRARLIERLPDATSS